MIMFREDSQVDSAEENVILNVSLRPHCPLSVCSILKPIISFKSINMLLRMIHKIKAQAYVCISAVLIDDRECHYHPHY